MKETKDDLADGIGLLKALTGGSISGNSTINLSMNVGAAGVWIAATCCLVMLAAMTVGSVVGGLWLVREFNRIDIALSERKEENDRAQTYLSSIFGRVPELKAQIDKETEKEKANAQRRSDHP